MRQRVKLRAAAESCKVRSTNNISQEISRAIRPVKALPLGLQSYEGQSIRQVTLYGAVAEYTSSNFNQGRRGSASGHPFNWTSSGFRDASYNPNGSIGSDTMNGGHPSSVRASLASFHSPLQEILQLQRVLTNDEQGHSSPVERAIASP